MKKQICKMKARAMQAEAKPFKRLRDGRGFILEDERTGRSRSVTRMQGAQERNE